MIIIAICTDGLVSFISVLKLAHVRASASLLKGKKGGHQRENLVTMVMRSLANLGGVGRSCTPNLRELTRIE